MSTWASQAAKASHRGLADEEAVVLEALLEDADLDSLGGLAELRRRMLRRLPRLSPQRHAMLMQAISGLEATLRDQVKRRLEEAKWIDPADVKLADYRANGTTP